MKKLIGKVGVDSGHLILIDPCYLADQDVTKIFDGTGYATPIVDNLGLMVESGLGDGSYEVYADIVEVEGFGPHPRIKSLEIKFF